MARVVVVHPADRADDLATPRDDGLVREADAGDGRFVLDHGPFRAYERRLAERPDGRIEERIDFALAVRFWGLALVLPVRRALAHPRGPGRPSPWWAPPERLDARAASVLGLLLTSSVVGGYLGTLITQTLTYVGDEFGFGIGRQKDVLTAVRLSVIVLVPLAALADRLGRRRLLLLSATCGCLFTATGAIAPNLLAYGGSQTLARGFASALLVLIGILSAEEMPSGSRAWAVSLISMCQALGAGMCVWFLPFAENGVGAWRWLYVLPILLLPLVLVVARSLPESRRFAAPHAEAHVAGHGRRFWLLAVTGFLIAVYAVPSSQLGNEFLREARGFSGDDIRLFTVLTVTPGALGIIVGGRLADVRGRRLIGAIGVLGGAVFSTVTYATSGATMWVASTISYTIGGLVVPALGVYRPELFPTSLRGRAGGVLEAFQVAGAVVGLQLVGGLVDRGTSYGAAFGLATIAPAIVALLIVTSFPETAHRSLEDLNPEDGPARSLRETA